MKPTVSVNLCCYNSEKYLRETLDSIVNQTYKDWELVIINDGSNDSTEAIIKEYIDKGYPIIYHYQENRGLSYSRNKALELSRGKYIALIDHDDVWLTNKLEKQTTIMKNKDLALCYGGVIRIDKNGKSIGKHVPKHKCGFIFDKLLKDFDIEVPTIFIRRLVLDNFGFKFDTNITASEEYCMLMQMAVQNQFYASTEIYAKYRVHNETLTNKAISKWADDREYSLNLICSKYPKIREKYNNAFKEAFARAIYYRARYFMSTNDKKNAIIKMATVSTVSIRYFILFLITLFPIIVWNYIHKQKSKRCI